MLTIQQYIQDHADSRWGLPGISAPMPTDEALATLPPEAMSAFPSGVLDNGSGGGSVSYTDANGDQVTLSRHPATASDH